MKCYWGENLDLGDREDFSTSEDAEAFKWWEESSHVDILGRRSKCKGPEAENKLGSFKERSLI